MVGGGGGVAGESRTETKDSKGTCLLQCQYGPEGSAINDHQTPNGCLDKGGAWAQTDAVLDPPRTSDAPWAVAGSCAVAAPGVCERIHRGPLHCLTPVVR